MIDIRKFSAFYLRTKNIGTVRDSKLCTPASQSQSSHTETRVNKAEWKALSRNINLVVSDKNCWKKKPKIFHFLKKLKKMYIFDWNFFGSDTLQLRKLLILLMLITFIYPLYKGTFSSETSAHNFEKIS